MTDNIVFDYAVRLLVSMTCGFLLGIERKSRHNPVGVRTLVLISISCCTLSILSVYMSNLGINHGDPTRIASTAVTGIGFIGGGVILKHGMNVRGLTTAAIIFTAAALGLCCGAALYIPVVITILIALIILFIMNKLESIIFPITKTKQLVVKLEGLEVNQDKIEKILKENGITIYDLNIEYTAKKEEIILSYTIKTPNNLDTFKLADHLEQIETLKNFTLIDK